MNYKIGAIHWAILFFLCCSRTAVGQNEIGERYKFMGYDKGEVFLDEDGLYSVLHDGRNIVLQKFSTSSLNLLKQEVFKDVGPRGKLETALETNSGYYQFYQTFNPDSINNTLTYKKIDFSDCSMNGRIMSVDLPRKTELNKSEEEVPKGKIKSFIKNRPLYKSIEHEIRESNKNSIVASFSDFYFRTNDDKTILLLCYENKTSNDVGYLSFCFFNSKMEPVKGMEVSFRVSADKYFLRNYYFNSSGKIYVLAYSKDNQGLSILTYDLKTETVQEYVLSDYVMNFQQTKLFQSENGDVFCSGFYAENETESKSVGLFTLNMSSSDSLKVFKYDFEDLKAREYRRCDGEIVTAKSSNEDLWPRNMLFLEDGSFVLIAEQFRSVHHNYGSYSGGISSSMWGFEGGGSTGSEYFYKDIHLFKINAKNELEWSNVLGRRYLCQSSSNKSFLPVLSSGILSLVYCDWKKSRTHNWEKQLSSPRLRDEVGNVSTIDLKSGKMKVTPLTDDELNLTKSTILTDKSIMTENIDKVMNKVVGYHMEMFILP